MSQISLGTEQELQQDKKNKLITLKNLDWHKNSGTGGMSRKGNAQSRDMASRDSHGSYLQRVATEKGNISHSGIQSSNKDDGDTNDAGSILAHSNTQVVLEPMPPSKFKPPQIIEEHPVSEQNDFSPKANYM